MGRRSSWDNLTGMRPDGLKKIIRRAGQSREPCIELIERAEDRGPRLGIFSSSFNPPTVAHLELIRRARTDFSLDEVLALAGTANADKSDYECALEDRLMMLVSALEESERVSIGLSSTAYYVDMVDAIRRVYRAETRLHFILGFDTFERVLDHEGKYTDRYFRRFAGRDEALSYLLSESTLIVAGRTGAGRGEVLALVEREPAIGRGRILSLDFPAELGERSASEVRSRVRSGLSISGLVPPAVEDYVRKHNLYR
jgi:nicotinate (nicotinamide) nucleotide adenylyltransferase